MRLRTPQEIVCETHEMLSRGSHEALVTNKSRPPCFPLLHLDYEDKRGLNVLQSGRSLARTNGEKRAIRSREDCIWQQ